MAGSGVPAPSLRRPGQRRQHVPIASTAVARRVGGGSPQGGGGLPIRHGANRPARRVWAARSGDGGHADCDPPRSVRGDERLVRERTGADRYGVVAYANAMRLQAMIGNTALIIESEMFGQPTLRAKWKNEYGGRPEDIQGLAVEEHVARLRDQLLPLVERAQRAARESIEAIGHMRQVPSMRVERAE